MTQKNTDDLITLGVAASLSGRSVQTLKRWIKGGRLTDLRAESDLRSPIVISREELQRCLSEVTPLANASVGVGGAALDVLRAQMKAYETLVEELRMDKRRLLKENKRLREKLDAHSS